MTVSTDRDGTHGVAGAVGSIMASTGCKTARMISEGEIHFMLQDVYSPSTGVVWTSQENLHTDQVKGHFQSSFLLEQGALRCWNMLSLKEVSILVDLF